MTRTIGIGLRVHVQTFLATWGLLEGLEDPAIVAGSFVSLGVTS